MPFTHQLVVLISPVDGCTSALCALARAQAGSGLALRDAAVLGAGGASDIVVTEPYGLAGGHPLGHRWWAALARAVSGSDPCSKVLIHAGVSKGFLAEIAEGLASGSTGVALVAEEVDIESLIRDVGGRPSVRVVYGALPQAAIEDLYETAGRRRVGGHRG
jgi:hypothetical protein